MFSFNEARAKIIESISPIKEEEESALPDSLGRTCAEDIVSPMALPQHKNSAMDGFAIRFEDLKHFPRLEVVGESYAGHPFLGTCTEGTCVRIMTGALLPEGCDTVIMQEDTELYGNKVRILKTPHAGLHVRHPGEDIQAGDIILKKGTALKAPQLGLLASVGISHIKVFRLPKVSLFSTGDELITLGHPLKADQLYDSNRYLLGGLLKTFGIEPLDFGIIPDDKKTLREQLLKMSSGGDVIISSGGISVGSADYVKEVLEEVGQIFFWKVAIKPGKPFAFGKIGSSYFFGLPGNPVSATVTFEQLVMPALRTLMGRQDNSPFEFKVRSLDHLKKEPGRTEFQRGILKEMNGEWSVSSTGSQNSGILSSLNKANCYIVLPPECVDVKAGDFVCVQPFNSNSELIVTSKRNDKPQARSCLRFR